MIGILTKSEISVVRTAPFNSDESFITVIIIETILLALGIAAYNYRVKSLQESLDAANSEKSKMS